MQGRRTHADQPDVHRAGVLGQLQADSALAGDDLGVVEGVDEGQAALALEPLALGEGLGGAVAVQDHLGPVAQQAAAPGRRTAGRHDHGRLGPGLVGRPSRSRPWLPAVTATSPRSRSSSGEGVREAGWGPRGRGRASLLDQPRPSPAPGRRSGRRGWPRCAPGCGAPGPRSAPLRTAPPLGSRLLLPCRRPGWPGTVPRIDRLGDAIGSARQREEAWTWRCGSRSSPSPSRTSTPQGLPYTERVGFHLDHDVR